MENQKEEIEINRSYGVLIAYDTFVAPSFIFPYVLLAVSLFGYLGIEFRDFFI